MDYRQAALSRRGFIGSAGALAAGLAFAPRLALAQDAAAPWAHVTAMTDRYVDEGKLAGAVATMGRGLDAPEFIARGVQTLGGAGMGPDSLFRVYSMTKPVTGMAAMILIDEGKLGLDQPLAEILPKFAEMQVQRVPDGALDDVVPAERAITIRHLLTHTAGLGYTIVQTGPIRQAYIDAGLVPGRTTRQPPEEPKAPSLAAFADRLADLPLVYQPGTKWSYSVGLDLLARVIEVVAGQSYDTFLQERLFGPLAMTSSFFTVPEADAARLTTNYGVKDGALVPIDPAATSIYLDPAPFPFGGAGLVSSPRDFDRFLSMILGYGSLDGVRIMSEAAMRQATSNLLPEGVTTKGTFAMGGGFGAGGRVGLGIEEGTFGWPGAAGTVCLADFKRNWRGTFLTQYMPIFAYPIPVEFPQAAMKDAMANNGGIA